MFGDERVEAVLADAGVVVAYLFGSRAQGTHRHDSDADVAVLWGGEPPAWREQSRLAERLRRAFGAPEVDLVVLDTASLELRGRVIQHGKVIYSRDEPSRVAYEVRVLSEFLDYLPSLHAHTWSYLRHVAERGA